MTKEEFELLDENGVYDFFTYTNEHIIGLPYCPFEDNPSAHYIIPFRRIKEFNESNLSVTEKVEQGVLRPINPEVIEECNIRKTNI